MIGCLTHDGQRIAGSARAPAVGHGSVDDVDTRPVDPWRPVEVLTDDRWCPGLLRAWQRYDEGWFAFVHVTVGVGMTYVRTVPAEMVRQVHAASQPR